jgi:hypothetical protein
MKGALIAHVGLWTHDLDSAVIFSQRCYGAAVSEPCRSGRRPGFVSRFVNLPVNYRANLSSFDHRSQSSQEQPKINEINFLTDFTLLCRS